MGDPTDDLAAYLIGQARKSAETMSRAIQAELDEYLWERERRRRKRRGYHGPHSRRKRGKK